MANKKTPTGQLDADKTRAEAAEALKRAAELIASLNNVSDTKTVAKKPAAKSASTKKTPATGTKKPATKLTVTEKTSASTAKKPTAKSTAAKKTPATSTKKTTAKSTETEKLLASVDENPTVKSVPNEESVAERKEVAAVSLAQEPAESHTEVVVEPKQIKESESDREPAPIVNESSVAESKANTVERESVKQAQVSQDDKKSDAVVKNAADTKSNKLAPILFILTNLLLCISSVMLIVSAFDVTVGGNNDVSTVSYGLFGYLSSGAEVKAAFVGMAGDWVNVGYAVIGILMTVSALLPLALVVKNLVRYVVKKDKTNQKFDTVITIAVLTVCLGLVNIFGANITAGHVVALVLSLAAYFLSALFRDFGTRPIYSAVNIILGVASALIVTGTAVYSDGDIAVYIANATTYTPSLKYAMITLIVAVIALGVLMATSLHKLPVLIEILISAIVGACALVTLIAFAGGLSEQISSVSLGGAFVFGAVLMSLLAVLDIVFAAVSFLKVSRRK